MALGVAMIAQLHRLVPAALLVAFTLPLAANDMRIWTSRQGSAIEAKLMELKDGKANLLTSESKVIKVSVSDLSLADRQHLVEYADADPTIISESELGEPEKDARISSKNFKRLDEKLSLFDPESAEGEFDLLETEHFLIATEGRVRPQGLAETAERLWLGMAFQHMNFRRDWGDQRMLIIAVSDNDFYSQIGKRYIQWLRDNGGEKRANQLTGVWDRAASTGMGLKEEVKEQFNLHDRAVIFNASRDPSRYRSAMEPFPTHCIAGALLGHQMGGLASFGAEGSYAIRTGHAYYKEIQLTGKTQTSVINKDDYETDEIATERGFEDGTSWARTLRKMVRKGDVKPSLNGTLAMKGIDLTPEGLVTMYSLGYYLQSTPQRVSAFAKLMSRIETSDQIPPPSEIATIYGFESAEAMEADWIEFIRSTKFK